MLEKQILEQYDRMLDTLGDIEEITLKLKDMLGA